jgi:hypothetical protein
MTYAIGKSTKGGVIAYWITTGILALGMFAGAMGQLLHVKPTVDGIIHLGYPVYLLNIIAPWKILGVLVLLLPGYTLIKEWAYAGFFFLMTGAVISHLASGEAVTHIISQIIFVLLIVASWYLRPANRRIAID